MGMDWDYWGQLGGEPYQPLSLCALERWLRAQGWTLADAVDAASDQWQGGYDVRDRMIADIFEGGETHGTLYRAVRMFPQPAEYLVIRWSEGHPPLDLRAAVEWVDHHPRPCPVCHEWPESHQEWCDAEPQP